MRYVLIELTIEDEEEETLAKKDNVIFHQMVWLRKLTLRTFKGVTEEIADIIPQGFKNSIRWNLGHVYLDQFAWLQHLTGDKMPYPEEFPKLFNYGTNPTQWEGEPPSLETLSQLLTEQPLYIKEAFKDRLDDEYDKKSGMYTVRQVLVRTLMHESMHLNTINAYKRIIKANSK